MALRNTCHLTARRLVLVNVAESTRGRLTYYTFCMTSSPRPSGAKHGAIFAVMVQLIAYWRDRGINLRMTSIDSRCRIWFEATGAVSRYKLPAGAINESRYRGMGAGRCAYHGLSEQNIFLLPALFEPMKMIKKKKNVRAHTQLPIFDGLAFTSPAKIVTSLLTLPSVLYAG